jgi:anaerobic magnesium-protoporphyrin IX monomethyl ester cyclase
VRWKSPQKAVNEIKQLIMYSKPNEINIDDDTLTKNPEWLISFCDLYKDMCKVPFYCNSRPELLNPTLVKALCEAGCLGIGIGIESGSERIRSEVLGRPMSDEIIKSAFSTVKKFGIKTWSFNMVGVPTESAEDLKKTIELNDIVSPDFVRISIFTQYPNQLGFKSDSNESQPTSYFGNLDSLSVNLQSLYSQWITQLLAEKRLWLTDAELTSVKKGLNDYHE